MCAEDGDEGEDGCDDETVHEPADARCPVWVRERGQCRSANGRGSTSADAADDDRGARDDRGRRDGRNAECGRHRDQADAAEEMTMPTRCDTSGGEAGECADQQRCGQDGAGGGFGDTEVLDHCHDHQGDEVRGDEPHDADAEDSNTAVGGERNPVGLRIRRSVDRH